MDDIGEEDFLQPRLSLAFLIKQQPAALIEKFLCVHADTDSATTTTGDPYRAKASAALESPPSHSSLDGVCKT